MLLVQFRMSKEIASLVSVAFYEGQLRTDRRTALARMPSYVPGRLWAPGLYWLDYTKSPPTHKLIEIPTLVGSG